MVRKSCSPGLASLQHVYNASRRDISVGIAQRESNQPLNPNREQFHLRKKPLQQTRMQTLFHNQPLGTQPQRTKLVKVMFIKDLRVYTIQKEPAPQHHVGFQDPHSIQPCQLTTHPAPSMTQCHHNLKSQQHTKSVQITRKDQSTSHPLTPQNNQP